MVYDLIKKSPTKPTTPTTETVQESRTVTQTVHYQGAGSQTPQDNVQSFEFTRTVTKDTATGRIISAGDWNAKSHSFTSVATPVINGYHADQDNAGGQTVSPDDRNILITVTYSANGKIVPVDPNGQPIPGAPTPTYPTDPTDPTKVQANEPVPNISGLIPDVTTVTPVDPGQDTPVIYRSGDKPVVPNKPGKDQPNDKPVVPQTPADKPSQGQKEGQTPIKTVSAERPTASQSKQQAQRKLPQTGNSHAGLAALGLGLLSILGLSGLGKKKED